MRRKVYKAKCCEGPRLRFRWTRLGPRASKREKKKEKKKDQALFAGLYFAVFLGFFALILVLAIIGFKRVGPMLA